MDTLKINQLKIDTFLGIYSFEEKIKQSILLDLSFSVNIQRAASTLSIDDTHDYSLIAHELTQFISEGRFPLLEVLAEQSATWLKNKFKLENLTLKITKIGCIPNAKEVSIEINR